MIFIFISDGSRYCTPWLIPGVDLAASFESEREQDILQMCLPQYFPTQSTQHSCASSRLLTLLSNNLVQAVCLSGITNASLTQSVTATPLGLARRH